MESHADKRIILLEDHLEYKTRKVLLKKGTVLTATYKNSSGLNGAVYEVKADCGFTSYTSFWDDSVTCYVGNAVVKTKAEIENVKGIETMKKELISIKDGEIELHEPKNFIGMYKQENGLQPFIDAVEDIVHDLPVDETDENRAYLKSIARKISSTKVYLANKGKDVTKELQAEVKITTSSVAIMKENFDRLRDLAKKPAIDFDNKEKQRVERINTKIDRLKNLGRCFDENNIPLTLEAMKAQELELLNIKIDESFEEKTKSAVEMLQSSLDILGDAMTREEERLYRIAESESIALENQRLVREAEKAKIEADAKKKAEYEASQEYQQKLAQAQLDKDKEKQEKEKQRLIAEESEKKERAAKKELEIQKEKNRKLHDQEVARQKKIDEEKVRAANKEHQVKVLGMAKRAIIEATRDTNGNCITESQARAIVIEIARGGIPNTAIRF